MGDDRLKLLEDRVLQAVAQVRALREERDRSESELRELQRRLDGYSAGVEVLGVRLLDVHPSMEVVDAFREVAGAYEEKNRAINEAEGYRNEQVALARGNALARIETAQGYSAGRKNRAEGDAGATPPPGPPGEKLASSLLANPG